MRLQDLGERGAIEVLKRIFDRGLALGIGDDCALVDWGDQYLLVTTDLISQRAHLPPTATAYQIGWYLVATNLSDVAAMGGYPLGFVAALALPRTLDVNYLRELARGMDECAKEFGIAILGGDTKEGTEITLAGTAFGRVRRDRVLLRSGARPGDLVVITGDLGRSGGGRRAPRAVRGRRLRARRARGAGEGGRPGAHVPGAPPRPRDLRPRPADAAERPRRRRRAGDPAPPRMGALPQRAPQTRSSPPSMIAFPSTSTVAFVRIASTRTPHR